MEISHQIRVTRGIVARVGNISQILVVHTLYLRPALIGQMQDLFCFSNNDDVSNINEHYGVRPNSRKDSDELVFGRIFLMDKI